jgi:hypothetical protein
MKIDIRVLGFAIIAAALCSGACRSRASSDESAAPTAQVAQATAAAPAPDEGAPDRLSAVLRGRFDDENVEAAIEALARSGVRVYSDDGSRLLREVSGRPAALKLFRQQARNMALLAAYGTATPSADLNAVVPAIQLGERALPMSAVLASYVVNGNTFGARLSRNLIGPVSIAQHAAVDWPALTLALFVAETVPPPPVQKAFSLLPVAHAAEPEGPCGVANEFLNSAGSRAVEAIAGPATGESAFLIGIVAAAADAVFGMAVSVARELASEALGLATVQKAMFAINLITTAQALFEQWTVTVVAEPARVAAINHGRVTEGVFRGTVVGGEGIAWPGAIQECATLLGLSLPGSPSAPGSKAKWLGLKGFGTVVAETHRDEQVGGDNTATLSFRSLQSEDASVHSSGGPTKTEEFRVLLIIENSAKEGLKDFLAKINSVVGSFLPAGAVSEVFKRLVSPWGSAKGELEYHAPRAATSTFQRQAVSMRAYTCSAPAGPWHYSVTHAAGGTTTGTFTVPGSYSWTMKMIVGTLTVGGTVALDGDALVFRGGSTAKTPVGGAASADDFRSPIVYGEVPECRAR